MEQGNSHLLTTFAVFPVGLEIKISDVEALLKTNNH